MTLPGSRTATYAYDVVGQLTSLTDWQSRAISFGYNADGQRASATRPNGVSTAYGYDTGGRLNSIVHSDSGGTVQSYSYTLDAMGNRTAVTTLAGTESYVLDALNRITSATYTNGDVVGYSYDAAGNRLTQVVNSLTTNSYTYDNAGQMTADGVTSYTYDATGNLLTAGADSYSWDWAGRLASATISGTTTSYAYDGEGVRASATTNSVATPYLWDRLRELPLLVDDGTKTYLHADGLLAEIDGSNAALYHLTDALGSVRGLTDGTGAMTGTSSYDAFGTVRSATGTTSRFGFTGEQLDSETGYTFLRARYLNPQHGRFISRDTVQPNAAGSQGYNRYAYVANNPCTWTDPSGRHHSFCTDAVDAISKWSVAAAVVGWLLGTRVDGKGGYLIKIGAFYSGTYLGASFFTELEEKTQSDPGKNFSLRIIEALFGPVVLAIGILVWGDPHLSIPAAFALLLAGVLLLLAAVAIDLLVRLYAFQSGVSGAICGAPGAALEGLSGFLGGGEGPSIRNENYVGLGDDGQTRNGLADMPPIPSAPRPSIPGRS